MVNKMETQKHKARPARPGQLAALIRHGKSREEVLRLTEDEASKLLDDLQGPPKKTASLKTMSTIINIRQLEKILDDHESRLARLEQATK